MSPPDRSTVRPEVLEVLRQLRGRIRRYVALEGVGVILVVLGLSFWLSLAADYWLEFPVGVRRFLLVLAAGLTAAAAIRYLVLRLIRVFRDRALALVLERRFPELNDRLITAVELAAAPEIATPLTAAMLRQTADEAAELSHRLQLREVFQVGPLFRSVLAGGLLVLSIGGFAWASGETMRTWARRNLLMADEYYRRESDLTVVILADPGARVVEFKDGRYKHPRGADLTFLATVPEGKKVPEEVTFSYRNIEHSGGGAGSMTRIGQRQFRQPLTGLHESIRLWLAGGDYSTHEPFVIDVVDPPQIDRLVLHALYPEYTGLNARDEQTSAIVRRDVPVLGAQVSLPAGTDFILEAKTNKPLREVRVQIDAWELRLTHAGVRLAPTAIGDAPSVWHELSPAQPFLAADGMSFSVPCLLSASGTPEVVSATGGVSLPLRLPPDALLRISLHDEDDIISAEPARLSINSIPDEPPQIETRLKGIGTSITRQATIPIVGEIQDVQDGSKRYGVTDDYGVAEARFEYKVERGKSDAPPTDWQPASFADRAAGRKQLPVEEKFAVLPLDLATGVRLTLKVVAVDADNLTGPHVSSGRPFSFQIVSDDELLSLIAVKELNLRRRFEQILDEMRTTRKDVLLARTRLEEVRGLRAAPPAGREAEAREKANASEFQALTVIERATSGTRKNANETQSIEEEFREIRDELENNAIPDAKPTLERIDEGIVRPLHSVNTVDYNDLDDALVVLHKVLEDRLASETSFDETVETLNVTIEHLEKVLAQMLELETVNEALQLLRDIIKSQEELQERTRQERKKKLIEGLQ